MNENTEKNTPPVILRTTHDAIVRGIVLQNELLLNDIKNGFTSALSVTKQTSDLMGEKNEELIEELAKAQLTIKKLRLKLKTYDKRRTVK